MEDVSNEKNVLKKGLPLEEEFSFSTKSILPFSLFLLALSFIYFYTFPFSKVLGCSAFLVFIASCLWDFKGLVCSCVFSTLLFLGMRSGIFTSLPLFVFFLSVLNTGFILAQLKRMWVSSQKSKEDEIARLKIWESHYYAFRRQCLEELEEVRNIQANLSFLEQELESLEKERMEEFLEEDSSQKALLELFTASQKKCLCLQSEVELLEEILLQTSKPTARKRAPRKEKIKEESDQRTFLF